LIILIILSINLSALLAQDTKVTVEVNGSKATDLKQQVEAGTITPEAAMKQAEVLKENSADIDSNPETNVNIETDDDDEKIVNIRSKDFLREISLSTKGYYGYDLFYTSRGFKMESTMTSYSDYQIGAGDEIIMAMWGDVELRKTLRISKEGTVYVNNIGLITVNGLTLSELEKKLRKLLAKAYITLAPPSGEPSTYLDVSLGKLKPITVFLVGEVFKKGALKLDSYSTVFTALYYAGGPTAQGSLRNIQVVRNGKVIATMDIYDYLLTGRKVDDIILKNNDNILVPPRYGSVKLDGEVNEKAIYELKEKETLVDLIKFSGGIKITSSLGRVQIERIIPFELRNEGLLHSKEVKEFQFGSVVKGKVKINPVKIENGDIVTIFPITDILINNIFVEGAVFQAGKYALTKNMTIGDLINKTGGTLPEAYLAKAELVRINPDLTTEFIDIDLTDEKSRNLKLESSDRLKIYSTWEIFSRKYVQISGHIKRPSKYALDENTKVSDLIFKSGSLHDPEFLKKTYLERADLIRFNDDGITTKIIPINLRKLLAGDETEDIVLKDKDHLKIYNINVMKYPTEVSISGLVRNPGKYDLQTNMYVEDLILQAGGFKKGAFFYEAEVFRVDPYDIKPEALSSAHKIKIDQDFFKTGITGKDKFKLQDRDKVVVRQYPDFQYQRTVELRGEVKFPGMYSLVKENETLVQVIKRAGGLKNEAFTDGIIFMRDSIKILSNFSKVTKGSSGGKMTLRHGDIISIPKHPGIVMVEGFVFSPGLVKYKKGWDLEDYVEAAGGVMVVDNYEEGETVVFYPGGAAEVDGWFFSPTVKEGSRIVVKRAKIPEEKDGMTIKEWVSLIASVVTISYYFSNY
ncbi:MAG: SLBB domain-containing protein, partial [Candidatus Delongbacteria bacterium]|nr:SLBB domain-containing protein [Candidatus Delongbacteria bacterium]